MKRQTAPHQRHFIKDSFTRNNFVVSFLVWIGVTAMIVVNFFKLPPVIPFFYSVIQSEKQLAKKEFIILIPILGIVFLLTHLLLVRFIFDKDRLFNRMLAATSLLISVLFCISVANILLIVL